MKHLSFLLPILVILRAIGGAFAMKNSNEVTMVQVWYYTNESTQTGCTSTNIVPCNDVPGQPCRLPIPELDEAERTIFKNSNCTNAYQRPTPY